MLIYSRPSNLSQIALKIFFGKVLLLLLLFSLFFKFSSKLKWHEMKIGYIFYIYLFIYFLPEYDCD